MPKTFYILDGHYQIYRAFYAPFPDLSSPSGEPTKATHVFCRMLLGLIRNQKPDYLAMTMDVGDETTFRRELDESYKANRDPAPEALHIQADRIVSIVKAMRVPIYALPGFEADDVMATMASVLADRDIEVYLVSRDKDLEQLITHRVRLFDVGKDEVLDADALLEKKGYTPEQALEIQTLTGDSTDNIRGVHGVGVKTALKLINTYGCAQSVIDNADQLTSKMAQRVKEFEARVALTRQLVTLRRDVPVDFSLADCATDRIDYSAARPIFEELNLNQLREQVEALSGDASATSDGATPVATCAAEHGTYHLVDTSEKLDSLARALSGQSRFAFDTETTGLNPVAADLVGLSFSWKSGEGYYVPVRTALGTAMPVDEVVEKVRPVFENAEIGKVGQNIKFDLLVLRQVGIKVRGVEFDTMIASFLLDPLTRSHSMGSLAKSLLGCEVIPITDLIGKGKNQITLDQVDVAQVCEYAAEDADVTWRLWEVLAPQMSGSYAETLFGDTEMPLVSVLAEMEHNGIALDNKLLGKIGEVMADRMIDLTREVHRAAGHDFNLDSTKQLAVVLFDEQGLPVIKKTKTGRSTDRETLAELVTRSDHSIPPLVLEYRELSKLKGTYVATLPTMVCRRTSRIHASFDQTGTVTGRLSSRDPNLQNIPIRTEMGRKIRRAFIAGNSDSVLLTADYSQIELRVLAHLCKDEALLEAFRAGDDIHRSVAAKVNGVSLDEVTAAQRTAAKAVNFGIIYGQSAFGLSRSIGIRVGEAREFIDAYFSGYPGIQTFIKECVDKARKTGYAETILGRRRPIEQLQSRNRQQVAMGERLAVNTVVQGSAADLIKRAMLEIHHDYLAGRHQARMLIQVHDELVFEVPRPAVDRAMELIREKMEHAIPLDVPIVVDIATGITWADCKA